jgi:hypothetical protein
MKAYVIIEVVANFDGLTESDLENWIRYQLVDVMEIHQNNPLASEELVDHVHNVDVTFEPPI